MKKCMTAIACAALLGSLSSPPLPAQEVLFSGTVDGVSGNIITNIGQSFNGVQFDVLEITSGPATGSRFLITSFIPETLFCNTGLLNDYTRSIEAAGTRAGDTYQVLESDELTSGSGVRLNDFSVRAENVAWPDNRYQSQYIYLTGYVSGTFVESFYDISSNSNNTVVVGQLLPAYGVEGVAYRIVTDPATAPPPNDNPEIQLSTDSDLTSQGVIRSISVFLVPGDRFNNNLVDIYIAALDPAGKLNFLKGGRWRAKTTALYRGLFVGSKTDVVVGVFLLGPNLPKGRYTVYGVLTTPGASVYKQAFWRSNLARTSFFIL